MRLHPPSANRLRAWLAIPTVLALHTPTLAAQGGGAGRPTQKEQPAVVPWIGGDLGIASPAASCVDCVLWYGGPALTASIGAGVMLRSGLSLGVEQAGMAVILADSPNRASLRLLTARYSLWGPFVIALGAGTGRYTLESERLVNDRPTGMVGVEVRHAGRVEVASFVQAFQSTTGGGNFTYQGQPARYRLRGVRLGTALRIPLLF